MEEQKAFDWEKVIQIMEKDRLCVIGKLGQGDAHLGREWIPPLWEMANGNFHEIQALAKYDQEGKVQGIWGLMSDVEETFQPWSKEGKYLAGCEAEADAEPPSGWTRWCIPPKTYVVVPCTMESYGQAFDYVLGQYLPREGYVLAGAVHEYYPQDGEKGSLYLYFPIGRK